MSNNEAMHDFQQGEFVIYQNGDSVELGLIKRVVDDGAFVWYHCGETAAKTPFECMRPLRNAHVVKYTSLGGTRDVEVDGDIAAMSRELLNEERPLPTNVGIALLAGYEGAVADIREMLINGHLDKTCRYCMREASLICDCPAQAKWRGPRPGREVDRNAQV